MSPQNPNAIEVGALQVRRGDNSFNEPHSATLALALRNLNGKVLLDCGNHETLAEALSHLVGSVIVFEGDSIMAGYGITTAQRMSTIMLSDPRFSGVKASYNQASSSNVLADVVSQYATQVYPYRPAATGAPKSFLFIEIGTNDIFFSNYATGASLFAAFLLYTNKAAADGFTVIPYTIAPRIEGTAFNQTQETTRQDFNKLLRTSSLFDQIIDIAELLPVASDTTYYLDGTHPTIVGNYLLGKLMAEVVGSGRKFNGPGSFANLQNNDARWQESQTMRSAKFWDFKGGVTGLYTNACRIAYNLFGTGTLDIVGAGTNLATNLRIEMYCRGGLGIGGPANQSDGRVRLTAGASMTDDGVNAVQIGGNLRLTGSDNTVSGVTISSGTGSPEGVVTARVGSIYLRQDGGTGTSIYVKESGTSNTGWVAK